MNFKSLIFFATVISVSIVGCSEKELPVAQIEESNSLNPKKKVVIDRALIDRFTANIEVETTILKSLSNNSQKRQDDFDVKFDEVYEINNIGALGSKSIFIEGTFNGNDVALFKVLNSDDNLTEEYFVCETVKKNDDLYIVNYYNSGLEKLYSVNIIPSKEEVIVNRLTASSIYKSQARANINKRAGGQEVMDCINDAYSNHGSVSVWAWV